MSRTPDDTVYFKFKLRHNGIYHNTMAEKHSRVLLHIPYAVSDLKGNVTDYVAREDPNFGCAAGRILSYIS